jgi:CRP/FNR family transcriptional regulator, cyclic AMP receptor protein
MPPLDAHPLDDADLLKLMSPSLARLGTLKTYRAGRSLIQEGHADDCLFIILKGRVRAFSEHASNERQITYGSYGPGEYVGEMSLDGGVRAASVEATQTSVCAMVTRHTLQQHLLAEPEFAFELLAKVIRRARAATLGLREHALNDAYGRLKFLLDSLANPALADGSRPLREDLTQHELANRIGCTRERVTRLLKDLQQGGYLRRDGRQIVLLRTLPPRY